MQEKIKQVFKKGRALTLAQEIYEMIRLQPNALITKGQIIKKFITYNENEIYNTVRMMTAHNIINKETIGHKTYLWMRRDEPKKESENAF